MIADFKNLTDLQKYFHSEEVCREFLAKARWGETPVCPHCGIAQKPYVIEAGKRFKCSDKDCGKKFSAISGTIFENTKISLQKWFLAIYICANHKKGISSHQLGRDLGVTQKSAWFILHRVREMLGHNAPELLEGIVQIDCTFIGGKLHYKSNAKRKAIRAKYEGKVHNEDGKTTVLGFLDGNTLRHQIVESENSPFVLPEMRKRVKAGSTIVTDQNAIYKGLKKDYTHVSVNHGESEYVKDGFTTNGIEGAFALLKRGIYGIYHSVSKKHLAAYCNEFAYRYNTRKTKDKERFGHSITQCNGKRLTYEKLIAKK